MSIVKWKLFPFFPPQNDKVPIGVDRLTTGYGVHTASRTCTFSQFINDESCFYQANEFLELLKNDFHNFFW